MAFHLPRGLTDFLSEHKKTDGPWANVPSNLEACCSNPAALMPETLSAFTVDVTVLQPMLHVAPCGNWLDMVMTSITAVTELRKIVSSDTAVICLLLEDIVRGHSGTCSEPLGSCQSFSMYTVLLQLGAETRSAQCQV
jgi:hypothetical protein